MTCVRHSPASKDVRKAEVYYPKFSRTTYQKLGDITTPAKTGPRAKERAAIPVSFARALTWFSPAVYIKFALSLVATPCTVGRRWTLGTLPAPRWTMTSDEPTPRHDPDTPHQSKLSTSTLRTECYHDSIDDSMISFWSRGWS